MVTFLFDGQIVSDPAEWEDTAIPLTYDYDNAIYNVDYSQAYTFYGDAYALLYAKYTANDVCDLVDAQIRITQGCNYINFNAVIFITACVFNESRCSVQVKFEDNAFTARIQNNRKLNFSATVTESKNGVAITPPTVIPVKLFLPSTGVFNAYGCSGWSMFDMMAYSVAWMSDGIVAFQSSFFQSGLGRWDWVTSAGAIRASINATANNQSVIAPTVAFQDLYDWARKNWNLAMAVKDVSGVPTLIVEHVDFFKQAGVTHVFQNVNDVELSFVEEILYSAVKVGAIIITPANCDELATTCNASTKVRYFGFNDETYSFTGTCNNESILDLSNIANVTTDPSAIQELLEFTANDIEDISAFIIQRDSAINDQADQSDPLGVGQFWYNEAYTNKEVIARYADYWVGQTVDYSLQSDVNQFNAESVLSNSWRNPTAPFANALAVPLMGNVFATALQSAAAPCTLENLDQDATYDPTLSITDGNFPRWTPQFSGLASFYLSALWTNSTTSSIGVIQYLWLVVSRYDSSGTLLEQIHSPRWDRITTGAPTANDLAQWQSPFISYDVGDYFTYNFAVHQLVNEIAFPTEIQIIGTTGQTFWETTSVIQSRPIIQTNTGTKRYSVRRTFDYPMAFTDQVTLLNNPNSELGLTFVNGYKTGYLEKATFSPLKNTVNISLITT
jgi:hypothetical protein